MGIINPFIFFIKQSRVGITYVYKIIKVYNWWSFWLIYKEKCLVKGLNQKKIKIKNKNINKITSNYITCDWITKILVVIYFLNYSQNRRLCRNYQYINALLMRYDVYSTLPLGQFRIINKVPWSPTLRSRRGSGEHVATRWFVLGPPPAVFVLAHAMRHRLYPTRSCQSSHSCCSDR